MKILMAKPIFLKNFVEFIGNIQTVFIFLLFPICFTMNFRAPPLIENATYLWTWNAPTENCPHSYSVLLDLSLFSLIGSPRKGYAGKGIILFYANRLGYYPHIYAGKYLNGGIPQLGHLQNHLNKSNKDIYKSIPKDKCGLAVIDWEDWRPTWARNWKSKDVYRNLSIELVQQKYINLDDKKAYEVAKMEFEKAGRAFMEETLKLGKSLRPNYLWGYYLFPDCYNHHYKKPNYNGSCFDIEKLRNDRLNWLWKESTALYPSIYLNSHLKSTPKAALFSRNRILESIRVSQVHDVRNPLPIFPYVRPVFTDTGEYLSETDLVNTIGEAIALGVSGIVVWGSTNLSESQDACLRIQKYMKIVMNPYLINVTLAAKLCNQVLCYDKGICIRKNWNSSDYLHLNPTSFTIKTGKLGKYKVYGKPKLRDLYEFSKKFQCSCFANKQCKERVDVQDIHFVHVCVGRDVCIKSCVNQKLWPCSSRKSGFLAIPQKSHHPCHRPQYTRYSWK